MATSVVLINFNVPVGLKAEFDEVCKRRNLARTSVLIGLIEKFIEDDASKRMRPEPVEEDDLPLRIFSTEWDQF